MNGIFGVGISEFLLVVLVMLIIGGPRNVVKWSYEAGKMLRQLREAWSRITADLNKELDPETRELVNASRELTRSIQDIRSATDPRQYVKLVEGKPASAPEKAPEASATNGRYSDWMPNKEDESSS